ncbi:hypothetical protein [Halovivax gelatinilyticus]|uniref:hypothetical protein n=1 Tax=Halovivax gelatinilyticus TaxID=2961597 RepID=UPI0020CA795C|nr:hypothetical protein [Halovivax gelatinilyticus]
MGDIFNREDTKNELKIGVVFFALAGLGVGLGVFLAEALESDFAEMAFYILAAGFTLPVLVAIVTAQRQASELSELPDNLVLGTAGVTAIAGTLVMGLLLWLFGEMAFDNFGDLGDIILPLVGLGIGAGAAAAGMVWVMRNLIDGDD